MCASMWVWIRETWVSLTGFWYNLVDTSGKDYFVNKNVAINPFGIRVGVFLWRSSWKPWAMAHGLVLFSSQCGHFDGFNLMVRAARVLDMWSFILVWILVAIWMLDVVLVLPRPKGVRLAVLVCSFEPSWDPCSLGYWVILTRGLAETQMGLSARVWPGKSTQSSWITWRSYLVSWCSYCYYYC